MILWVYVDGMIISGYDAMGISDLKTYLKSTFKMKDHSALTYFLA